MKTELELLEERKNEIKRMQKSCDHEWGEPYSDPVKEEIIERGVERMGVDVFSVPVHTGRYRQVERWCVMCSKCQKKEYYPTLEEALARTKRKTK